MYCEALAQFSPRAESMSKIILARALGILNDQQTADLIALVPQGPLTIVGWRPDPATVNDPTPRLVCCPE
jgi:hypothetical protein